MTDENLDLRQRKFWGWGFASEVTDPVASDALLHALHDRLDLPIQDFGPGPTISEIELKSPRVRIPASLAAICSDTTWDRAEHTYGKNLRDYVRGFERRFDNPPDFVAFPRTEDELTAILRAVPRPRRELRACGALVARDCALAGIPALP